MPKINKQWAMSQLQDARVSKEVGNTVVSLLNHWETLNISDKSIKDALDIFSKLANNIAIVEVKENDGVWVPAQPGAIKVGDTMMVLLDAYDSPELAPIHNGRVGKVVRISYGNIVLAYTDGKQPEVNMAHHSPFKLQKLIKL